MESGTCFIVGAGSFDGMRFRPGPGDLVIAADGGYKYLKEAGICPDVLIGDFDSLAVIPEHERLIRHSPVKDDTDMALAAAYGESLGFRRFLLYGGLGRRLDHTIANLQLLAGLSRKGCAPYLVGEGNIVTAITGEKLLFRAGVRGILSVFCAGESALGVTERGLKYSLDRAVLTCDRGLGVSNEFTGQEASVEVEQGTLLLIWDETEGFEERRVRMNNPGRKEE